jgi:hypothetical protein
MNNQDYKTNCMQNVNWMPRNRLLILIKKLHPKRQKEPKKTTEETSGCVRDWTRQVAQLLDCYIIIMMINNEK